LTSSLVTHMCWHDLWFYTDCYTLFGYTRKFVN